MRRLRLIEIDCIVGGTLALAVVTGTATITLRATPVSPTIAIDAPLPTGANAIGSVSVSALPALAAGTNSIGNIVRQSGFTDSVAALAASASFTGTGRVTTGANFSQFVASAFADQAGSLFVEQSLDTGATYQVVATVAVTASTAARLTVPVTGLAGTTNLFRVRYVNGGTLQTLFRLASAFIQ